MITDFLVAGAVVVGFLGLVAWMLAPFLAGGDASVTPRVSWRFGKSSNRIAAEAVIVPMVIGLIFAAAALLYPSATPAVTVPTPS